LRAAAGAVTENANLPVDPDFFAATLRQAPEVYCCRTTGRATRVESRPVSATFSPAIAGLGDAASPNGARSAGRC
jgi:hypothetical protein